MDNQVYPFIIGLITITVSIATFVFSSKDRKVERMHMDMGEITKDRDTWKRRAEEAIQRAEIAERRADDYADRYFNLIDRRQP